MWRREGWGPTRVGCAPQCVTIREGGADLQGGCPFLTVGEVRICKVVAPFFLAPNVPRLVLIQVPITESTS
jgi:hypothetical protein